MSALEASAASSTQTAKAVASPELALQGLYERHSDRILGFCLRRLGSRPEAEDAVQNTFLNAFRALQRGVRPVSEAAWLFKIAENACLAAHRANGRRRSRELDHDPELVGGLPAGESTRETAAALRAAVARLPEGQRRALLLREWRGLSYREIATQLGLSVAAVETLIFRARKNVAGTLEREIGLRGRIAGVFNLGSLASAIKSAFTGAAAVKVAAAAAVLTLATLPAGDSPTEVRATTPGNAAIVGGNGPAGAHAAGAREADSASAGRTEAKGSAGQGSRKSRPGSAEDDGSGSGTHGAGGGTGSPDQQAGTTLPQAPGLPAPTVPLPHAVQRPTLPETPALPQVEVPPLPPVPSVPELPKVPEVPAPPALPVQVPDPNTALPTLPKLP
jgi:RNA polymerase sigma-70 factor, ECF subfamily